MNSRQRRIERRAQERDIKALGVCLEALEVFVRDTKALGVLLEAMAKGISAIRVSYGP